MLNVLKYLGQSPTKKNWFTNLPTAPYLRNSEWTHCLLLAVNHSRISQVIMLFISNFLNAVTCQLLFALALWPSVLGILHLSLSPFSTLPASPCPPPWRHTCVSYLKGFLLVSHLGSSKGGTHRRLSGGRFWVFIPQDSSLLHLSRRAVSHSGRWITIHSHVLTIARCCTITCSFPAPCFLSNTFIKLHSNYPVWVCPVSCWDLINCVSWSMINFL